MTIIERTLIKKGKNAVWLAKQLGVSHQAVYGWLGRKYSPAPRHIVEMSKLLGIKNDSIIDDLL